MGDESRGTPLGMEDGLGAPEHHRNLLNGRVEGVERTKVKNGDPCSPM